eukprot:TRINITY_DN288_c0_g2_i1.p1 TRINITY_DN288_c0_g2~~TRINITY_DN288_c0_g2_i1.p1  ORF type:complete len:168 (-),score=59.42 TRINITY_DN288_c0_g2_i1:329-832(-)
MTAVATFSPSELQAALSRTKLNGSLVLPSFHFEAVPRNTHQPWTGSSSDEEAAVDENEDLNVSSHLNNKKRRISSQPFVKAQFKRNSSSQVKSLPVAQLVSQFTEDEEAANILLRLTQSVPSCMGCGATSTPAWRNGGYLPGGKKRLLCNACGLRWKRNHRISENSD